MLARLGLLALCLVTILRGTAHAQTIEGRVTVRGVADSSNAVVYIDKIAGKRFAPPATPAVLDQVNLKFMPHVLPILVGTRVAFPNSDAIRHNVFSPTANSKFNLGTYPRGNTMYRVFDKPGAVTLLCNVHAEMSAYVVVLETPYFAVTDKSGGFTLRDVPPGKYILKTWHAKARPATMEIEVSPGGIRNITLDLRK
jgi:plastocyanin